MSGSLPRSANSPDADRVSFFRFCFSVLSLLIVRFPVSTPKRSCRSKEICFCAVSLYQQESAWHGSCFYDESVLHDGIVHSKAMHHQKQSLLLRLFSSVYCIVLSFTHHAALRRGYTALRHSAMPQAPALPWRISRCRADRRNRQRAG